MTTKTFKKTLIATGAAVLATAAAAPAASATTWGIADQKPATFANPAFGQLKDAGMKSARYTVRYDALKYKSSPSLGYHAQQLDDWLTAAKAAGYKANPLVAHVLGSINRSRGNAFHGTLAVVDEL